MSKIQQHNEAENPNKSSEADLEEKNSPIVSTDGEHGIKERVQAFLVFHKNDEVLVNPKRSYSTTLLDNMFAPRPKKLAPPPQATGSRLKYYQNLKHEGDIKRASAKNGSNTSALSPGRIAKIQVKNTSPKDTLHQMDSSPRSRIAPGAATNSLSNHYLSQLISVDSDQLQDSVRPKSSIFHRPLKYKRESEAKSQIKDHNDTQDQYNEKEDLHTKNLQSRARIQSTAVLPQEKVKPTEVEPTRKRGVTIV